MCSYYEDYVASMGLGGSFRSHTTVTGVRELRSSPNTNPDLGSETEVFRLEAAEDDAGGSSSVLPRRHSLSSSCSRPSSSPSCLRASSLTSRDPSHPPPQHPVTAACCPGTEDTMFEVTGYRQLPGDPAPVPFSYLARNVVLATGQADTPSQLGVAGEQLPCVLHALAQLTSLVKTRRLGPCSAPVVVVGAGLSAADAIIAAHSHSIPVVHVFRKQARDPGLIFSR